MKKILLTEYLIHWRNIGGINSHINIQPSGSDSDPMCIMYFLNNLSFAVITPCLKNRSSIVSKAVKIIEQFHIGERQTKIA